MRRIVWRARATLAPRPRILAYHRVAQSPQPDAFGMYVSPAEFAEHLRLLRTRYRPLGMAQFLEARRAGNLPRDAVVLTFDDGYADNVINALPLLEQFEIPATFFITAGYIGSQREFWWDALDRILHGAIDVAPTIRETLDIPPDQVAADKLYAACREKLLTMSVDRREEFLAHSRSLAGIPNTSRDAHRSLDESQLTTLAKHPLAEIGAHSVNHPDLTHLDPEAQFDEILTSRQIIEERINRRIRYFAYPFGACNAESEVAVQRAGFNSAFTTEWAPVTRTSSPWRMPRLPMSATVDRLARSLAHTA